MKYKKDCYEYGEIKKAFIKGDYSYIEESSVALLKVLLRECTDIITQEQKNYLEKEISLRYERIDRQTKRDYAPYPKPLGKARDRDTLKKHPLKDSYGKFGAKGAYALMMGGLY